MGTLVETVSTVSQSGSGTPDDKQGFVATHSDRPGETVETVLGNSRIAEPLVETRG